MILPVDDIRVKKRVRNDMGDLEELCQSMHTYGLFNPVTINKKKILLAGYRRLQAAKILGWKEIECTVIDAPTRLARLEIEAQENNTHKGFTSTEMEILEERLEYLTLPFYKAFFPVIFRFLRSIVESIRRFFTRQKL